MYFIVGNSHEIGIFQTLETKELKLYSYEIFLCGLFQGAYQKYFHHLAQLIGDGEGASAFSEPRQPGTKENNFI